MSRDLNTVVVILISFNYIPKITTDALLVSEKRALMPECTPDYNTRLHVEFSMRAWLAW